MTPSTSDPLDRNAALGPYVDPRTIPQPRPFAGPGPGIPPVQGPSPDPFQAETTAELLTRRGQQFARGAGEVAAGIPEALARGERAGHIRLAELEPELAPKLEQEISELEARLQDPALGDDIREFIQQQIDDKKRGVATLREAASTPAKDVKDQPSYSKGQALREWVEAKAGAPDPRDTTFWGKLAEGAGSMTGFLTTAVIGTAIGGPGVGFGTTALTGGALNESQIYREAREAGASEAEALEASRLGFWLGTTEAVPISRALHVLPPKLRGEVGSELVRRLSKIGQAAGEEGIQEAINGIGNNLIASGYYDPERGWSEGVGEQFLIGAILGGGVGAIGQFADQGREESSRPKPPTVDSGSPSPLRSPAGGSSAPPPPWAGTSPNPGGTPDPVAQPDPDLPPDTGAGEQTSPPQVARAGGRSDTPDPTGRFLDMDETETVDGESVPTGRRVRVDLQTGQASVIDGDAPDADPDAPDAEGAPAGMGRPEGGEGSAEVVSEPRPAPPIFTELTSQEIDALEFDPETFQYKSGGDEQGVTDRLRDLGTWDQRAAGTGMVYEYENGRRVIVDGHQRLGLAKRMRARGQETPWRVEVLREADGYSEGDARRIAAMLNIQQDSGTALDAAKVIRESGEDPAELGLPPRSQMVQDATGIAKLSEDAYGMVVNEVVTPSLGGIVGRVVDNQALHADILKLLDKLRPANKFQAETIARQAAEETTTETQTSLFGDEEIARSLYLERAKVLDGAVKRLRQDERTFKTLIDRADTITGAGNQLDEKSNTGRLASDQRVREYLTRQANSKGPISDALATAARRVADGDRTASVVKDFVAEIRKILEDLPSDRKRPDQPREEARTGEAEEVKTTTPNKRRAEDGAPETAEQVSPGSPQFDERAGVVRQKLMESTFWKPERVAYTLKVDSIFTQEGRDGPITGASFRVWTTKPGSQGKEWGWLPSNQKQTISDFGVKDDKLYVEGAFSEEGQWTEWKPVGDPEAAYKAEQEAARPKTPEEDLLASMAPPPKKATGAQKDMVDEAKRAAQRAADRLGIDIDFDKAAAEADPNPTEAQKLAGNYKMGHQRWNGLDLTIETAKGQERSGTDADGETWSVTMPAHYGYIKGTEGADGDHVDVYVGPDGDSDMVLIIDQVDAKTREFDEHKVIIGFRTRSGAQEAYVRAFSDGKGHERAGAVTEKTVDGLKEWLAGNTTKPVGKIDTSPEADLLEAMGPVEKPKGTSERDKAEIGARQQQSKMRRLDQERVEDDAGGLFGGAQGDMFSAPQQDQDPVKNAEEDLASSMGPNAVQIGRIMSYKDRKAFSVTTLQKLSKPHLDWVDWLVTNGFYGVALDASRTLAENPDASLERLETIRAAKEGNGYPVPNANGVYSEEDVKPGDSDELFLGRRAKKDWRGGPTAAWQVLEVGPGKWVYRKEVSVGDGGSSGPLSRGAEGYLPSREEAVNAAKGEIWVQADRVRSSRSSTTSDQHKKEAKAIIEWLDLPASQTALEEDRKARSDRKGVDQKAPADRPADDALAPREEITTRGTKLKWSNLAEWNEGARQLANRKVSSKLYEAQRAHLEQLAEQDRAIFDEASTQDLRAVESLTGPTATGEFARPQRGARQGTPHETIRQIVTDLLAQREKAPESDVPGEATGEAVDFEAFKHPVMAVTCPDCKAKPGTYCKRPSGHRAADFHASRKKLSDEVFIAQYGEDAWIERLPDDKWKVHLDGAEEARKGEAPQAPDEIRDFALLPKDVRSMLNKRAVEWWDKGTESERRRLVEKAGWTGEAAKEGREIVGQKWYQLDGKTKAAIWNVRGDELVAAADAENQSDFDAWLDSAPQEADIKGRRVENPLNPARKLHIADVSLPTGGRASIQLDEDFPDSGDPDFAAKNLLTSPGFTWRSVLERSTPEERAAFAAEFGDGMGDSPTYQPPRRRKSSRLKMSAEERTRLDEIKAKLADKLRNQTSSGLDPEFVTLATEAAAIYIKAGARTFRDFLLDFAEDLGVNPAALVRYARIAYNDTRDELDLAGEDVSDMDDAQAVVEIAREYRNAPGTSSSLERDRGTGAAPDAVGEAGVSPSSGPDGEGPGSGGGAADPARGQREGGGGVSDGDAAGVGARGAGNVRPAQPGPGGRDTGSADAGRGNLDRDTGLPPDRGGTVDAARHAADGPDVSDRRARQRAADKIKVKPRDEENIRATLPLLLPAQQDDVLKAERSFEKRAGMLFTNGTGTGKTYSGGGLVKRYFQQGKDNILIAAPSQGILDHWTEALEDLGVPVHRLETTRDHGKGVTLTTYANLGDNTAVASREWDLIVADESHKLSQNEAGDPTAALDALRAISNNPKHLAAKSRMRHAADWEAVRNMPDGDMLSDEQKARAREAKSARLNMLMEREKQEVEDFKKLPRTNVLFMSATPFAYAKNVDYAEGYLFDYGEGGTTPSGSNQGGRELFMVENFGYRIRYHRLTKPDANVDTGVFERQFHEKLKREGALSGRMLDIDADYDRHFVEVHDAIGTQIDDMFTYLRQQDTEKNPKRAEWREYAKRVDFKWHHRMQFLEQIKARAAIDVIKADLALGRKVVVFHDFNKGGGITLFPDIGEGERFYEQQEELRAKFPRLFALNAERYQSPISAMLQAFPGRAAIYNGTVPLRDRKAIKAEFNRDGSGLDVIVVQSAAGEAGIDLHDVTGNHQRAEHNLGMPVRPPTALQEEGRIRRTGSVSDAIFRYYTIGTTWERVAFAQGIARKSGTVENLALGDQARSIRNSFIEAYQEAAPRTPSKDEGKGGRERDRAQNMLSPYEAAKTHYFGRMDDKRRRQSRAGIDHYATPEPLGFKMAEWVRAGVYERLLEPSAGDGAIARYFPEHSDRTLVEPSNDLLSTAQLRVPGAKALQERFEDHHIVNKYHGIVMNPPFGSGGKTAIDHLAKAAKHLKDGGRIVALIPTGPSADKRFDAWYESDDATQFVVTGEYRLPSVTFEKAGTAVNARVLIIDRISDAMARQEAPSKRVDLTGAGSIKEFFDRLEDIGSPDRPKFVEAADPFEDQDAAEEADEAARPTVEINANVSFNLGQTVHGKTGEDLFVATFSARQEREVFDAARAVAKANGGWWSSFRGRGAIPGFQFTSEAARQRFLETMGQPIVSKDQRLAMFYSPLVRALEGAKQKAAPAKDWKAIIGKLDGVKKAEIDWMGLEDWLDAQEGQVPRDAIVQFARSQEVVIEQDLLVEGFGYESDLTRWQPADWDSAEEAVDDSGDFPEPDYELETGEAIYPDDWSDEAEAYEDDARDELLEEAYQEWDGEGDEPTVEGLNPDDVQERAEQLAMERFEAYEFEATLRDRNEGPNYPDYEGTYDTREGFGHAVVWFDGLPGTHDGDTSPAEATREAYAIGAGMREKAIQEELERQQAAGLDREGRTRAEFRKVRREEIAFIRAQRERNKGATGAARFMNFTEPGGVNYREILLRVPNLHQQGPNNDTEIDAEIARIEAKQEAMRERAAEAGVDAYRTQAYQDLEMLKGAAEADRKIPFAQRAHFIQENIVVHARVKDRTARDGKRVLFVEEIQSDLASKWREQDSPERIAEHRRREEAQGAAVLVRDEVMKNAVDLLQPLMFFEDTSYSFSHQRTIVAQAIQTMLREIAAHEQVQARGEPGLSNAEAARVYDLLREHDGALYDELVAAHRNVREAGRRVLEMGTIKRIERSTPDTPFKEEATYALMSKRLLRMAAEEGYDAVAWTPGYMQAERWDSGGENITAINWGFRAKDGRTDKVLHVTFGSGSTFTFIVDPEKGTVKNEPIDQIDTVTERPLASILGGALAKRVLEEESGNLADLKMAPPSSGYAVAYDQQTKKAIDKLVKKHGGRVEVRTDFEEFANSIPKDARIAAVKGMSVDEIRQRVKDAGYQLADQLSAEAIKRQRAIIQSWGEEQSEAAAVSAILSRELPDYEFAEVFGLDRGVDPVWSVTITPEIREAAMRPQSLFKHQPTNYVERVQFRATLRDVMPALRDELDRLNLKRVHLEPATSDAAYSGRTNVYRDGFMEILIAPVAGQDAEYFHTLHHESIHALRALNLFTPAEWTVLERAAARRWVEQYRIPERYPELLPSEQIEEAIAEAFADHAFHRRAPRNADAKTAFQKIHRFFKAIMRVLAGKGYLDAETVFGRTLAGKVGARGRAPDPFTAWFGDSKIVDEKGKPRRMFHGSFSDFQVFDPARGDGGNRGLYFTPSPSLASGYAESGAPGNPPRDGGQVYPVYLSVQNPKIIRAKTRSISEWLEDLRAPSWKRDSTTRRRNRDTGRKSMYLRQEDIDELRRQGYDGIVNEVYNEVVVFDPSQVKSVFNRGTWGIGNPIMRDQRGRHMPRPLSRQGRAHQQTAMQGRIFVPDRRIWEELTRSNASLWDRVSGGAAAAYDWIDKGRIRVQDRMLPLLRAEQAVARASGRAIHPHQSGYIAEETFSGKVGRHLFEIDEQYVKPIIEILARTKGGLTVEDAGTWLYARHALERNRHIASINPDMPDGGSGMENDEATYILAHYAGHPHFAELQRIGDLIDRLRDRTLDLRLDAGLLSVDDAEVWKAQYAHYVPLKGFAETDHSEAILDVTGVGRRFNVRGSESRRALGRYSTAFNPLQAAITQAQEVAVRAEKNRVGQKVYQLAKAHPSKALWTVKKPKMKRYYNRTTGLVESRLEDPRTLFMEPNEMAVKVNGAERRIVFHDERLARALGQVGADQMGWFMRMMSMASRWVSSVNTMLDPEFVVRNAFRDLTAAQLNIRNFGEADRNKLAKAMVRDWRKAFMAAYRGLDGNEQGEWGRWWREFEEAGAKVSFWRLEQPEAGQADLEKRIKLAGGNVAQRASRFVRISTRDNPVLGFIERTNLAVDNAIRLAAYVQARKAGWSKEKAASLSKNLTVNFNRRGEWGATINALYVFANASIQGTQVLLRAISKPRMWKYVIGLMALGALLDQVNAALSAEDDDGELAYDKIPDWKNQTNLVVMLGPKSERGATVWMPYGYNVFPYIGQQASKVARGVKPADEAIASVAKAMFSAFSPINGESFQSTITPTLLDPINEMAMNEDWLGRPIRPENAYADYGPNAYKYYGGVSTASREISDFLNRATGGDRAQPGAIDISPEYIDHAFGFATGGAGRTAGRLTDITAKLLEGRPQEIEDYQIPFWRAVQYETSDWLDRDRYYRFRDEVREAKAAVKVYQEEGRRVPKDIARIAKLDDVMRDIEGKLRKTRAARQGIEGNDALSSEAKGLRVERIRDTENNLFIAFNRRFLTVAGPQAE